mmetsp:Transcript_11824/g.47722  ORF Transcript_11824/g.47722 Transcript_11824/m.47722 type:complete len:253 (-) Transcript_11824:574-1332(-)
MSLCLRLRLAFSDWTCCLRARSSSFFMLASFLSRSSSQLWRLAISVRCCSTTAVCLISFASVPWSCTSRRWISDWALRSCWLRDVHFSSKSRWSTSIVASFERDCFFSVALLTECCSRYIFTSELSCWFCCVRRVCSSSMEASCPRSSRSCFWRSCSFSLPPDDMSWRCLLAVCSCCCSDRLSRFARDWICERNLSSSSFWLATCAWWSSRLFASFSLAVCLEASSSFVELRLAFAASSSLSNLPVLFFSFS